MIMGFDINAGSVAVGFWEVTEELLALEPLSFGGTGIMSGTLSPERVSPGERVPLRVSPPVQSTVRLWQLPQRIAH